MAASCRAETAEPPRPRARRHACARSRRRPGGCWSTQGVDGLALRAVAREMGMTAPALYRYFSQPRGPRRERRRRPLRRALRRPRARPRRRRPGDRRASSCSPSAARFRALGDHPPCRVRAAVRQCRGRRAARRRTARSGGGARPRWPPRRFGGIFAALIAQHLPGAAVPGPGGGRASSPRCRSSCATGARRSRSPLPLGRHARLPVLLDPALRPGLHGGVRPPEVRPRRRRAAVRGRAARPGGACWASPTPTRPPAA